MTTTDALRELIAKAKAFNSLGVSISTYTLESLLDEVERLRAAAERNCAAADHAAQERDALRVEWEGLQAWNQRISVCRDHTSELVDGECLVCRIFAAHSRAASWQDRYMREVEGLNNEGDPIGGDPPSGLLARAQAAESALAELRAAARDLADAYARMADNERSDDVNDAERYPEYTALQRELSRVRLVRDSEGE